MLFLVFHLTKERGRGRKGWGSWLRKRWAEQTAMGWVAYSTAVWCLYLSVIILQKRKGEDKNLSFIRDQLSRQQSDTWTWTERPCSLEILRNSLREADTQFFHPDLTHWESLIKVRVWDADLAKQDHSCEVELYSDFGCRVTKFKFRVSWGQSPEVF